MNCFLAFPIIVFLFFFLRSLEAHMLLVSGVDVYFALRTTINPAKLPANRYCNDDLMSILKLSQPKLV